MSKNAPLKAGIIAAILVVIIGYVAEYYNGDLSGLLAGMPVIMFATYLYHVEGDFSKWIEGFLYGLSSAFLSSIILYFLITKKYEKTLAFLISIGIWILLAFFYVTYICDTCLREIR